MSPLQVYNSAGKKVRDQDVSEQLTSGPIRKGLLYYMVNYQLAKRRAGTHDSKTRGAVSGTTKKMYRQKGTGRARHGAAKANIFVGGGVAFGPHPRDYGFTMPKKAKRRALQTALALKNREGNLKLLEKPGWSEPKTKQAVELFKALGTESALWVLAERNEAIEKSVRNLHKFKTISATGLNVYDILNHELLIISEDALEKINQRLGIK